MKLKRFPELFSFLSQTILNSDPDHEDQVVRDFASVSSSEKIQQIVSQAMALSEDSEFPVDELGSEANRWFGDAEEGRVWIKKIASLLDNTEGSDAAGTVIVKDSHGTQLSEGDSVTVIKDLKVKGGSSDLKRGTLVKNIRLTDDPEHVECRVDGSTLVLKVCFLKKA